MVHGYGAMIRGKRISLILLLAAGSLVAWTGRVEALIEGTWLTNYVEGVFNLASGTTIAETIPGRDKYYVPNSASAWVVVTNEPQMCFAINKVPQDRTTWAITPQASPGQRLCFTISFSNCGTATPQTLIIRDVTPADTVMSNLLTMYSFPTTQVDPNWYIFVGDEEVAQTGSWAGYPGPIVLEWVIWSINYPGTSGWINYCVTVL